MNDDGELTVHIKHDEETGRWFISESDIAGLWLEAPTAAELVERIRQAAPELIALNADGGAGSESASIAGRSGSISPIRQPRVRPIFDSPLDIAAA